MTPEPALPALPPASEAHGNPGHDVAGELQREIEGLRRRRLGQTYDQIASDMGYADASGARQMVVRALRRRAVENVAELRVLENDRIDADEQVLRAIIHDTGAGPAARIRAIDARTRLSARRSRLNGLDAPLQLEISTGATAEVEDALALFAEVVETVEGRVVARVDEPAEELGPAGTDGAATTGSGTDSH